MPAAHFKVHACNFKVERPDRRAEFIIGLRFSVDGQIVGFMDDDSKFVMPHLVTNISSCVEKMDAKIDF